MTTPEQMLQEMIEKVNALSDDELETLFREAGFNPVRKENESCCFLSNKMSEAEWIDPVPLTSSLSHCFMAGDRFLDIAA